MRLNELELRQGELQYHQTGQDSQTTYAEYTRRIEDSDAMFLRKLPSIIAGAETLRKMLTRRMGPSKLNDSDKRWVFATRRSHGNSLHGN